VRKKRFSYSHTTIAGTPFQYLGQPIPILKGRLIAAIGFLVYYISSHFFTSLLPWVPGTGLIAAPWVIVRSAAFNARYSAFRNMTFHFDAGYVIAYAYIQARSGNLAWNSTRLGPLRFESTLRCKDLVRLYVTNALGIVASLGLLIPWAAIRTWKYRADNMKVWQEWTLAEFRGSDKSDVAALGAETLDLLDVDLSR
jgi:uncharacterized membrane protein YjgN (DUF898 family)